MSDAALPPPPPADELARRLAAFQQGLRVHGLDGALLVQSADVLYLSGSAQNAHLAVAADGEPVLLVRRDLERARAESALSRVEPLTSLRALTPALAGLGLGAGSRIGMELDVVPAAQYLRYRDLLEGLELVDAMPALWAARSRKSAWELERIARAAVQSAAAMALAPSLLAEGARECDVLTRLGTAMREHGHEGTIRFRGMNQEFFFGQVLGGPSAAVPGPTETPLCGPGLSTSQGRGPSRRELRRGDAVVVDVSGLAEGYVSDQTRTFALGEVDGRLREAYGACREILAACVELLRPGTPSSSVYARGLEVATELGFADHYMGSGPARVRFVGHCIGLELNEPPYLAHGWDEPLAAGNVAAVEPKLVFPGLGAVGVENTYLVEPEGAARCLTSGSEELVAATA